MQDFKFEDIHHVFPLAELGAHLHPMTNATDETLEPTFSYAQLISSLQFAAPTTRADIAYAVNNAAQFKNHPTFADCNAVQRILKYLRGTSNYRLTLGGNHSSFLLTAYADADYAAAVEVVSHVQVMSFTLMATLSHGLQKK